MAVVASAPGKVLVTGGYLILERPNSGIVLSTNARFYAIVRPLYEEIKPESWAWAWTDVKLTSPQLSREAFYKLSLKNATLQCTSSRDSINPFVEQAVQYSVAAAQSLLNDTNKKDSLKNILLQGIDITILGCNDFYSYRNLIFGPQYLQNAVIDVMKEKWDNERAPFSLPPLMELLLGEPGTGGSSTPSMVGAVKRWQKVDPEKSLSVWKCLAEANALVENQFKALSRVAEEERQVYKDTLIRCSELTHNQWSERMTDEREKTVINLLQGVRDAFLQIRSCMKQMGEAAGVPIEPESQTQLLDATMNIEGTLLAGVPGAGGFDAVFAITLGNAKQRVAQLWTSLRVLPLLVKEDPHGASLENGDPRILNLSADILSIQIR
ncbi:GHMP kinase family protein isoform X2 [Wolffia australiana]